MRSALALNVNNNNLLRRFLCCGRPLANGDRRFNRLYANLISLLLGAL